MSYPNLTSLCVSLVIFFVRNKDLELELLYITITYCLIFLAFWVINGLWSATVAYFFFFDLLKYPAQEFIGNVLTICNAGFHLRLGEHSEFIYLKCLLFEMKKLKL